MKPVQAIGVFHDQNGSMPASVAASEPIITARPASAARVHVTRIRYEQPRSAGVPTPLPRISTLCVLPRPPGISSVFSARRLSGREVRKVLDVRALLGFDGILCREPRDL